MNEKEDLKNEFYTLIDKTSKTKDLELCEKLKVFNKSLEKYESFIKNGIDHLKRFLSNDIKSKMKKYVDDIIDRYEHYPQEEKDRIKGFLCEIIQMYGNQRNLIDKVLSVLGKS